MRSLVPGTVREFKKLSCQGDPYRFERWDTDRAGSLCLYYSFESRDGSRRNVKRIPIREIEAAYLYLRNSRSFDRSAFKRLCPVSEAGGPCGYAVVGRLLEALGVGRYSGTRTGFVRARDRSDDTA